MSDVASAALSYHEPGITTILIQSSVLLLLNGISYVLDGVLFCGLIGQILIGIAWGTPGGKLLDLETEHVIVQLGYLGLILLVYEGGLSTSFPSLKANLLLSTAVALTGISIPMGLSLSLQGLVGASPLQCFAAGAALCSTSLGTTFTILGTSGLTNTRLGTVLTSAAMMDDVVGLVMVQVIANLGGASSSFNATTIIRPVFVSLSFATVSPLACYLLVVPFTTWLNQYRLKSKDGLAQRVLVKKNTAFLVHTTILLAMITGATYAGTSNLFAAYLAGAMISWWDSEVSHHIREDSQDSRATEHNDARIDRSQSVDSNSASPSNEATHIRSKIEGNDTTGIAVYHDYYLAVVDRILKPFFFASIGFSIPITRMFTGVIVWRGVIYALLMAFGKVLCGLWLIRLAATIPHKISIPGLKFSPRTIAHLWGKQEGPTSSEKVAKLTAAIDLRDTSKTKDKPLSSEGAARYEASMTEQQQLEIQPVRISTSDGSQISVTATTNPQDKILSPNPTKPMSLYPASILGLAMVARGEIGFLISALAESNGIFSSSKSAVDDEIFLIITWAIVLCTIIGPVGVGLLVRRVKRLEREKESGGGGKDVLGVWGVS